MRGDHEMGTGAPQVPGKKRELNPEQIRMLYDLRNSIVSMPPEKLYEFLKTIIKNGIKSVPEVRERISDREQDGKELDGYAESAIFDALDE